MRDGTGGQGKGWHTLSPDVGKAAYGTVLRRQHSVAGNATERPLATSAVTMQNPSQHRLTLHPANGVVMVILVAALVGVLSQGCAMTAPPEATVMMDRDEVVTTLVNAWAPNGWAVVNDTPYSVTFERMPTAEEAFQVGSKPLRIVVTIAGQTVRARCYIGNQDASTGRWAIRVQDDFNRLLR